MHSINGNQDDLNTNSGQIVALESLTNPTPVIWLHCIALTLTDSAPVSGLTNLVNNVRDKSGLA